MSKFFFISAIISAVIVALLSEQMHRMVKALICVSPEWSSKPATEVVCV
jgi:hypothetical protein